MTAHQQTKLNELAKEYRSTRVREDSETLSIFVECYDIGTPERCVRCGDDSDHLGFDHPFWVAHPVAQFRINPSGAVFNLTPLEHSGDSRVPA